MRYIYEKIAILLLVSLQSCFVHAELKYSSSELTVWKLYHDFSWQALMHAGPDYPIHHQPVNILRKYFTEELADLIKNDYECAEKEKEICNLNFDIIFNSQDASILSISIDKQQSKNNIVVVKFNEFEEESMRYSISYEVQNTKEGFKISNIIYSKSKDLKKLLASE
ncbi:MAG: hypothetical protein V4660_03740 [Pseudomonadota bacterium]